MTVGIEEIITEVTSCLCYFLTIGAGSIQGFPFGYPDYIEVGAIHDQRQLMRATRTCLCVPNLPASLRGTVEQAREPACRADGAVAIQIWTPNCIMIVPLQII